MFSWGEKWFCPYSYTQADIREFESNNSLECCHEVQIGKQNVRANKVYAGMKDKKFVRQVSQRTPLSKFVIGLWLV